MTQPFGPHPSIGVSAWTFHRQFKAGTMDYPQFFAAVRGAGLRMVELNSPFFTSLEPDYLASLKRSADSYGIQVVNIAIDDTGYDLSSADQANRRQAVDRTLRWMDASISLGCTCLRNNTGGTDWDQCVASFTELALEGEKRKVSVLIEAHGGFSSDADSIVPLIQKVREKSPSRIGLIPDFGNVRPFTKLDRYAHIEKMAPFAYMVHPKMHDFDEYGQQPEWDTRRLINIIKKTGYRGPWIIEFEGKEDAFVGLRKSILLLSDCLRD